MQTNARASSLLYSAVSRAEYDKISIFCNGKGNMRQDLNYL